MYCGRPEDGVADSLKALQLSPQDSFRFAFLNSLTISHYALRNYEAAADAAVQISAVAPEHALGFFNLAAAYGQLSRSQEAGHALRQGMRIHPDFGKEFIAAAWAFRDAADRSISWRASTRLAFQSGQMFQQGSSRAL